MIETLISSKTRLKLLLKFFLNSQTRSYLRNLEDEFGESTNAIRVELNRLENAQMLVSHFEGNKRLYRVNTKHPLFKDIHNIVLKYVGLDQVVEHVIKRLGNVEQVYLTGTFSRGIDSEIIDLVFVGYPDKEYLSGLIEKAEKLIKRRIRYISFSPEEFDMDTIKEGQTLPLILWNK